MSLDQIKVELQGTFGTDRTIANAAWTSSFSQERIEARSDEDVARVVRMLAEQGHGTPFEHVVLRYWMSIPIFVSRQLVKYRAGVNWNEMSGRYRTLSTDYYVPDDIEDKPIYCMLSDISINYYKEQMENLKAAKNSGDISEAAYKRQREIQRGLLPQSLFTEISMTINLRALMHMAYQRIKPEAQIETRDTVEKLVACLEDSNIVPVTLSVLKERGFKL